MLTKVYVDFLISPFSVQRYFIIHKDQQSTVFRVDSNHFFFFYETNIK